MTGERTEMLVAAYALTFQVQFLWHGGRLEPTLSMLDIGKIDGLAAGDLPVCLRFWRSTQKRIKHRNRLFDESIGITPLLMFPDQLHCFNLGALLKFSRELLWMMMWSSVWASRRDHVQEQWIHLSLIGLGLSSRHGRSDTRSCTRHIK